MRRVGHAPRSPRRQPRHAERTGSWPAPGRVVVSGFRDRPARAPRRHFPPRETLDERTAEFPGEPGHRLPPAPLHQRAQARARGTADHQRGQGRPRLGRPGQAVHRGPGRPLVYGARLRRGSADRRRHPADAQDRLHLQLRPKVAPFGHRPFGEADRDRAGAHVEGLLQQLRLRGQRHRDQADLVLQQRHRPAREEEDHQPRQGLSRHHHRRRQPHRSALQPHGLRSADQEHPAHRLSAPLSLRPRGRERGGLRHPPGGRVGADDPRRRARDRRRLHRRAGHGRRRRYRSAQDLLGKYSAGSQEVRHSADRRRGDLRFRAHRRPSASSPIS